MAFFQFLKILSALFFSSLFLLLYITSSLLNCINRLNKQLCIGSFLFKFENISSVGLLLPKVKLSCKEFLLTEEKAQDYEQLLLHHLFLSALRLIVVVISIMIM